MPRDDFTLRRLLRQKRELARQALAVPPMDGDPKAVLEDLVVVQGLIGEVEAETRAIAVVPDELLKAVVLVVDAVAHALACAKRVTEAEKKGV